MSGMTNEELDQVKVVVQAIIETATPLILKAIAASRPGTAIVGELVATEPLRDYRAELWIGALLTALPLTLNSTAAIPPESIADEFLLRFDERFSK